MQEDKKIKVVLNHQEKKKCLEEINKKLKKIIYVYEKGLEPESNYNYKIFCESVLLYVSSSNTLFNGELINIVVDLNTILTNEFEKKTIKKLVMEMINNIDYLYNKMR